MQDYHERKLWHPNLEMQNCQHQQPTLSISIVLRIVTNELDFYANFSSLLRERDRRTSNTKELDE